MPTVQVPAQLTVKHLLAGVKQLPPEQFREFMEKADRWRTRQARETAKNGDEAALLEAATAKLPASSSRRMKQLTRKLSASTLAEQERQELIELTDAAEQRDAERLEALVALARKRGVDLDEMMQELGLKGNKSVL